MMLNIKLAELQESYVTLLPISFIFSLIFLVNLIFLFRSEFVFLHVPNVDAVLFLSDFLNVKSHHTNFNSLLGLNNNLKILALAIYTDYLFAFLVSGYVLLLAMIAAIILTIQKSFTSKSQNIYAQIMGDFNKTVVNYS
jgi:NADH:ubiquinone oxidoreductase subunit 6 (subunit J)